MIGAVIILLVTVAFGLLLYYNDRRSRRGSVCRTDTLKQSQSNRQIGESQSTTRQNTPSQRPAGCCGQHLVCEKLDSPYREKPVYFDDEELDRFKGRPQDEYTLDEEEEFREILLTMRHDEVPQWLESLNQREISLPDGLRDEVMLYL